MPPSVTRSSLAERCMGMESLGVSLGPCQGGTPVHEQYTTHSKSRFFAKRAGSDTICKRTFPDNQKNTNTVCPVRQTFTIQPEKSIPYQNMPLVFQKYQCQFSPATQKHRHISPGGGCRG